MIDKIRVAMLDDHQGIIDGYLYRLSVAPDIEVVATMTYGEALEPTLAEKPVDVLLLDVQIPIAPNNPNPYPILYIIPKLLQLYPDLAILVISMYAQRTLIQSVMETGVNGYVLKDDQSSIEELPKIIHSIVGGGIHMSQQAYYQLIKRQTGDMDPILTSRQQEALSLYAAYPDASTSDLANVMKIANSTFRNLLSGAYIRLGVRNRIAAIAKARQMGLITPNLPYPDLNAFINDPD